MNENILTFVNDDHPILSTAMPVVDNPKYVEPLSQSMFKLMWANDGIGLAAPQVGMYLRMFIMGPQEGPHYVCINPEVIAVSDNEVLEPEGCLTYPDLWLNISRPAWIDVKYQTLDGSIVEKRLEGLMARCYLHELDHLDGVVFTKKVSRLKLEMAKKKKLKRIGARI
jgi:peptide deformylase